MNQSGMMKTAVPWTILLWILGGVVCPPTRVLSEECSVEPADRQDCGFPGINERRCGRRGCCWTEDPDPDTPQCYHSAPAMAEECTMETSNRVACEPRPSGKEECLENNCCWKPSTDGTPWCYQSGATPTDQDTCGIPAISPETLSRVIGGDEAIPHSWPWMVSMQWRDRHRCGGSLINHRWVLTAGHCISYPQLNSPDDTIVLGAHSLSDNETTKVRVMIDQVIVHEGYRMCYLADNVFGGVDNDIALIRLAEPITYTDVMSPVCLAQAFPSAGKQCYSMGWGLDNFNTEDNEFSSPDLMQQFMSPIVDSGLCNSTDWYNGRLNPTSLCAGYEEGGRGNCFGDSGGPLVCQENGVWEQVGIVSWGEPCALARYPTIYADVSRQVDWIEEQISKYD